MKCLLVGNPNAGKTTLFNTLTGDMQRVGNWSGVTVAEKTGVLQAGSESITLVDLPGMYALDTAHAHQKDEQIAINIINSGDADCLINVIDATQLERHLYLTSQLLALNCPMVIVLTMMDKAQKQGIQIDIGQLERILGCSVVDRSREVACDALLDALKAKPKTPMPSTTCPGLSGASMDPADKPQGVDFFKLQRVGSLTNDQHALNSDLEATEDAELAMMDARYQAIHDVVQQVETREAAHREQITAKLDRVFLHRGFAFPIFLAVMYSLFFCVITVGGFFQEKIMQLFDVVLLKGCTAWLHQLGTPDGLITWLINGMGLGVATTLSFIPVMGVMFFLLAALEESGYMARVAFVMDRAMRFLGLPGKAFVPLIVGFGCNVPAVMATRTLDSARDRRLTILMSPFMSCGARLTIYTVFVAAFFPQGGYNIVFSLYLIGILMAVLTGLLLRKTVFSGPVSPLLLELPVYHLPVGRVLLRRAAQKLRVFLWRAGKVIVPVCMLLGLLNAIPVTVNSSLLVLFAKLIQPLFSPMGIASDNWPAVVGLITGMLAKEVVVGSLNSLSMSMGGLSQLFDGAVGAYAYLLFILLYVPCASTVAVIKDEAGRRLMWFSVFWSTGLAYSASVLFYQLGTAYRHPEQSMAWVLGLGLFFSLFVWLMRAGGLPGGPRAVSTS